MFQKRHTLCSHHVLLHFMHVYNVLNKLCSACTLISNLQSTPRSTKPRPPSRFSNIRSIFLVTLMHATTYTSQPYHTPWSNYPNTIIFNPFVAIQKRSRKRLFDGLRTFYRKQRTVPKNEGYMITVGACEQKFGERNTPQHKPFMRPISSPFTTPVA